MVSAPNVAFSAARSGNIWFRRDAPFKIVSLYLTAYGKNNGLEVEVTGFRNDVQVDRLLAISSG